MHGSISQTTEMPKSCEDRWELENTNFYSFLVRGPMDMSPLPNILNWESKFKLMKAKYKVNYWKLNIIPKELAGFSFTLANDRLGSTILGPPFLFIFMPSKNKCVFMGNLCWSPCLRGYISWNWVCLSILVRAYMNGHSKWGYIPNPHGPGTGYTHQYLNPGTLGLGTHAPDT